jgi:hypothetical protein
MDITQIGIVFFGPLAIFLVSCKEEKTRRWGYVCGCLSQPFWFWTAIINEQWGILILSFFYAFSWMRGVWNFWIKPKTI